MPYRATAKTEARRARIRQRILDAAEACLLDGGFSGLSISGVAADAGVATGTIYRHFSGKVELCTELFRAATRREVEHVRAASQGPGTPAERLQRCVRVFAGRAFRGRSRAYALIAEPLDPALEQERLVYRRAYADVFRALITEGVAGGDFPPMNPSIAATALVGVMAETLVGPLSPSGETLEVEQQHRVIHEISRFCLRAVGCERSL